MSLERRIVCDGCHVPFDDFNDALFKSDAEGPMHKTKIDLCDECKTKLHNILVADNKNHNRQKR